MSISKKILPYALAGALAIYPLQAFSNPLTDFTITAQKKIVEFFDTDLDSILNSKFWGKEINVTKREVPILMYHEIGEPKEYGERYTVSPDMFKSHLQALNDTDHVLISLDEYVNGVYRLLPKEKKPVILTFDDATEGQFRYKKNKFERYHLDPDCAVAILHDFAKHNPSFRMKGTFFIDIVDKNGYFEVPFKQTGLEEDKIKLLLEMGFDIGNHTTDHINMTKSKLKRINNSSLMLDYVINLIKPDYIIDFMAYPYGALPMSEKGYTLIQNNFSYACAAWGGRAPDISSKRFNKYAIPRIEINNDFKNLEAYVLNR